MKKTILLVFGIILSTSLAQANQTEEINGDITYEEGFKGNGSDFYNNDKELNANELKEDSYSLELIENFNDFGNREGLTPYYVPETFERYLHVPMYFQKTNYWCGPASVEMIIDFYRGSVYNQETYASYMGTTTNGTDIGQIQRALNNYQSQYHYDIRYVGNFQAMIDKAYYSIRHGAPFIANINTNSLYNQGLWAYPTNGHYIVVRSIYYDRNTERFTGHVNDPWKVGKCTKTYQTLYQSVANHWNSSIVH